MTQEMDEKIKEGWSEWIDVGKLSNLRKLIIYVNTTDLIWRIGVIING